MTTKPRPFRLSQTFIDKYKDKKPPFGFNGLGEIVFMRSYSRNDNDQGNEMWWEACQRVVEGTYNMQKRHIESQGLDWSANKAQYSAQEMYDRMFNMKFLPPGRGIRNMGSLITEERGLFAALNSCAFTSTRNMGDDPTKDAEFMMDMSMLGIGVGFDVDGANANIVIQEPDTSKQQTYVVPDSREGWVESVRLLLRSYFLGEQKYDYDYSEIRPKGAPIKGFGGISSGHVPLMELHQTLGDILQNMVGKSPTVELVADLLNLIGVCVVSGNIRRTAQIMLGDPTDEYIALKDYRWDEKQKKYIGPKAYRAARGGVSNNSVRATLGMDYSAIAERTRTNGEPGYIWLENIRNFGRMGEPPNYADTLVAGVNPCVTGDTIIPTSEGPRRADELLNRPFDAVVNGLTYECKTGMFETGVKQTYVLQTVEGHSVGLTEDQEVQSVTSTTPKKQYFAWTQVRDLVPGDKVALNNTRSMSNWGGDGNLEQGWLLGNLLGDGYFHSGRRTGILQFWGDAKEEMLEIALRRIEKLGGDPRYHKLHASNVVKDKDMVSTCSKQVWSVAPEFGISYDKDIVDDTILRASSSFQRGFLRGFFDANGSVQGNQRKGVSVRLGLVDYSHLVFVQKMLLNLGINSTIYPHRRSAKKYALPNGSGEKTRYNYKTIHELVVSVDNLQVFAEQIGFDEPTRKAKLSAALNGYKRNPNRERFVTTVKSITEGAVETVYDGTVEDVHRFGANGFIVHNCTEQSLEDKEICTLVETFPARHDSLEDFKRTLKYAYLYGKTVTLGKTHWPEVNSVLLRNRRIGCSITGVQQFLAKYDIQTLKDWLTEGYEAIRHWDDVYSKWLAVRPSIKVSSIKPSGSVSLLAGSTAGMHWPVARYQIRRVIVSADGLILKRLKTAGYRYEPAVVDPKNTVVVEVPIDMGDGIRTIDNVSMWEQLEMAAFLQRYWADNQVSVTVTFDPDTEGQDIEKALNYYQYSLKSVSFMPNLNGRGQVYPQMPIEAIDRETYEKRVAELKPLNFSRINHEETRQERFCDGETCMVE